MTGSQRVLHRDARCFEARIGHRIAHRPAPEQVPSHRPEHRRYPALTQSPRISRRAAFHGLGIVGLAGAVGLLAPTAADAADVAIDRIVPDTDTSVDSDLVVVDQMGTGPWQGENCGPTSAVIALVAVGNPPEDYVAGEDGSAPGANAEAVQDLRARCGLSPHGDPAAKSVEYWGAYLSDLERGIEGSGSSTDRTLYRAGVNAAAEGEVVILQVHHGTLIGDAEADYGHFVVAQGTDAEGNILVSDPGRAQSIGITGYSRERLIEAGQGRATIVR